MKKSLKILSFVISIFIFVSFVGNNRVKAVSAGAVLGAGAIVACVGAIASLIANDSVDLVQSGSSVGGYTVDASSYRASSIIDSYLSQYDISSIDDIDDINILIEITDPQKFIDYCGGLDSFTSDEYIAYYTISHIHYEAENNKFFTDVSGLIFSPDTFSDIVNSVSSDVISGVTGKEASVSFLNGIRNISIVDTEDHYFPELCERFGAVSCIRAYSTNHEDYYNGSTYLVSRPYSGTHYFVGVMSNLNRISFPAAISYHSPTEVQSKNLWSTDTILSYYIGLSLDGYRSSFIYTAGFFARAVYSDGSERFVFFSTDDANLVSPLDRVYINLGIRDISLSFDNDYVFEFDDYDKALAFSDYLAGDVGTYNPDDDVYTGDDVISGNLPLSDTEKKVGAYEQDHQGVEDIDIVVDPGAVKADDGTTTYNPSISVNDTPLDDIDVTGYLDLDDTLDRFQFPSSISTKFPFSLPFDIYNLFNVFSADPVTPKFTVPLDMTSVGGEVYNIDIDLSDFDDIANIVRWLLYGLFLIGLIILTNKLIGRG